MKKTFSKISVIGLGYVGLPLSLQFARSGGFGVVHHGLFYLGEGEAVAVANDWDDESFFGAHGHSYVVIVVLDEVGALDANIEFGDGLEGVDDGLDEEGGEAGRENERC